MLDFNNYDICLGNCNKCKVEKCPYDGQLTVDEYDNARDTDKQIERERETTSVDMTRYVHNRPDKEAYVKERNREIDRRRYRRDIEKRRKQALKSYYKNRDKKLSYQNEYYQNNKTEMALKSSVRYHANKEDINARRRDARKDIKELWKTVMIQTFFIDGTPHSLLVMKQKSITYASTGISQEISQVVDMKSTPLSVTQTRIAFGYKYVFEETDLNTNTCTCCKFISMNTIRKYYPWFLDNSNKVDEQNITE